MTRTCDPPVCVHVSPIIQRKSAGVGAAAELHLVQHLPSNCWSNSGQCRGGHMTPLHKIGSALLFMPTPPELLWHLTNTEGSKCPYPRHFCTRTVFHKPGLCMDAIARLDFLSRFWCIDWVIGGRGQCQGSESC